MSDEEKAGLAALREDLRVLNMVIAACNNRLHVTHSERDRAKGEAENLMRTIVELERGYEARCAAETSSGVI